MRNRLSAEDYSQLLSCIESIHRCRSLDDFPMHVLTELRKMIDCNLSGYNEVNLKRNRIVVVFDPPQPDVNLDRFGKLMHQHPIITYFDCTGDGQALKISDFLGSREYHRLAIYRDFYRGIEAEDQIAIGIRIDPTFMIGIAFNRNARTFTEKDRARLNLVRPHIIQAYSHVAEIAGHLEQERDLQTALRENGLGLMALSAMGSILHSTPGALDRLAGYIPIPESAEPRLPESILKWALETGDSATSKVPFVIRRDQAKFIIRRVRQEDRLLLFLSEESGEADAGHLDRFQLTHREREVLTWVAEGKSNADIATILGLTAGTVKLHVERILAKLGVENRTAAAVAFRSTAH